MQLSYPHCLWPGNPLGLSLMAYTHTQQFNNVTQGKTIFHPPLTSFEVKLSSTPLTAFCSSGPFSSFPPTWRALVSGMEPSRSSVLRMRDWRVSNGGRGEVEEDMV